MDILVLAIGSIVWAGILVAVAMALQSVTRISGAARQALWRIVAALVIAPWIIAPLADWAGIGFPAPAPATVPAAVVEQAPIAEPVVIPMEQPVSAPVVAATVEPVVPETPIPWPVIVIAVIITGWSWRMIAARLAGASLGRIVADASDASDGPALRSLKSWSRRLGFRKTPRLLVVAEGLSPFSFGAIRPVICLPQGLDRKLGAEALDLVVGHECLHVARGDGWLRPVERLVADLVWFNPFAWRIRHELDVARELACDEAVLKHAQAHRAYARTLCDVAGITAGLGFAAPAASMSLGGRGSLMLRVKRSLASARSKPARLALCGVALVALAGVPVACVQGVAAAPRVEAEKVDAGSTAAALRLAVGGDVLETLGQQVRARESRPAIVPARLIETPQDAKPSTGRVLRLNGDTYPVIDGNARLLYGFGYRNDPFTGKKAFHPAIDVGAYWGAPIHAPTEGAVTYAGLRGSYGRVVELDIGNGAKMNFGHLNTIKVETGDQLKAGDVLGTMGSTGRSTGPHLHLEYLLNGKAYDPLEVQNLKFATSLEEPPMPPPPPRPQTAPVVEAPPAPEAPRAAPTRDGFPPVPPPPPPASGAKPVELPRPPMPPSSFKSQAGDLARVWFPARVAAASKDDRGPSTSTVVLVQTANVDGYRGCTLTMRGMTDLRVKKDQALKSGDPIAVVGQSTNASLDCENFERRLGEQAPAKPQTPVPPAKAPGPSVAPKSTPAPMAPKAQQPVETPRPAPTQFTPDASPPRLIPVQYTTGSVVEPKAYAGLVSLRARNALRYGDQHPEMIAANLAMQNARNSISERYKERARPLVIAALDNELVELREELKLLARKYGPKHPEFQIHDAQIAAVEKALAAEMLAGPFIPEPQVWPQ